MTEAVPEIIDHPQPAPAAVDPPPPQPDPQPDAPPQPDDPAPIAADAHGNKGKPAWWMRELAAKDAENARIRAELDAALALAQRSQTPGQQPTPPQPTQSFTDQQIEARAHELNVRRDIAELDVRGTEKFGQQWTDSVAVLNTLGANNMQFMGDILAADKANAADVIHALASQPEKLATLMRLPQAQRVAELVRISMSGKHASPEPSKPTPAPKLISKAPAPPPPLNAGGAQPKPLYADELSDDEFNRQWDERATERARRRGFKV